ncbi:MAG: BREX-1 system adenine-specific DNA-methyltransferase [Candidatus Desulfovibrio kirbyi]|uniref:site-specific DNA-methyltransferase (adenine-specific) n=1 Tax=Candidatus Desulfovibrio kirbyi TaxID=2696086 RepID=A0A6L2R5G8_9BACT|nr:MAG: BREX-1 system adenine-specific DNA-methyltransferase [Candidatus Desulfovibrio kirbyi]
MAFDQTTRNRLARFVGDARTLLADEFTRQLQNEYGLDPISGDVADFSSLGHLDDARRETARMLRATLEHYLSTADASTPAKAKKAFQDTLQRIAREQAFTVLNRLCALRMAEARGLLIESIGKGYQSQGFQLYQRLAGSALGETGDCYRHFLFSIFDEFAIDLSSLFNRFSPQGRLFPGESALLALLEQINHHELEPLWAEDETLGWMYQYFNQKTERDAMRQASRSPRNSREMAVRNQFFTPRYVVEFLTDNTLGRIWYEMTKGETSLKEACHYLVRRPHEIFLAQGEKAPEGDDIPEGLSQEELIKQPVHIPSRTMKDPRDIRVLDPACGSGHFLLYAFDLLERIYEEAYNDDSSSKSDITGKTLKDDFKTIDDLRRNIPKLIVEHNLHGIDIDPRAVQIAGLSLWLRAHRAWKNQGVRLEERPRIQRTSIVCAEPMPGEIDMLNEFVENLRPKLLGQLVKIIFEKMKLAGEAGSLLKIEEEIKTAVDDARQQYEQNLIEDKKSSGYLPSMAPKRQNTLLDFTGLPKFKDFWNQAENMLIGALRKYAEETEGGYGFSWRLFSEDAARGFAFIDLCRKRYDVVLMNPPFGASSKESKEIIEEYYPRTKGNVLANFIERTLDLTTDNGIVGAISSRTPFFLTSFEKLRAEVFGKYGSISLMADLGDGVLEAMVETAIYTIYKTVHDKEDSIFFRLLTDDDKESELQRLTNDCIHGNISAKIFLINTKQFSLLNGIPYAYWVSQDTIQTIGTHHRIEGNMASIRVGLQTGDNFRFLRCLWEIPPYTQVPSAMQYNARQEIRHQCLIELSTDKKWVPFSKTEAASPWFSPITLVANFSGNGYELRNFTNDAGKLRSALRSEQEYFKPGFSYMLRSTRLVPYLIPAGVIPAAPVSVVFPFSTYEYATLGICASNIGSAIARFKGGNFSGSVFQASLIQGLPASEFSEETLQQIKAHVDSEVNKRRAVVQCFEPFQEFTLPAWIHPNKNGDTVWDLYSLFGRDLENRIAEAIGLNPEQLAELERDIREAVSIRIQSKDRESSDPPDEDAEDNQELNVELIKETPELKAIGLVMYVVGIAFGRWDIRMAIDQTLAPDLPAPFDPLPVCPPAMLVGSDGLPATSGGIASEEWLRDRIDAGTLPNISSAYAVSIPDDKYPIQVAWHGVLADDPTSAWDISDRSRRVFQKIFNEQCEDTETQVCGLLGVNSLSDYLRKQSGFFADHLSNYSKNRRKAPIYWPLSTASGAYTLWLYYHRLNSQTLYTCINDFVDPKLKQFTENIGGLRGRNDRTTTQERDLERLTDLEQELKDFRDELLRIATFWKPNLNDGVQITAAPLWKLFQHRQWRTLLKDTWEKLEAGDYDWAHLALSIWPDRVVRASHKDHSYAIVHDLEDNLWHEVEIPRRGRGRAQGETATEWRPKDLSESDLQAIIEEVKTRRH